MPSTIQLIGLGLGITVLVVSFGLVRQGLVREKYAVQWVFFALVSAILALFPGILNWIADLLGIVDPPNLLIFLGLWFLIAIVVHLTLEITRLQAQVRVLAEEVALFKSEQQDRKSKDS